MHNCSPYVVHVTLTVGGYDVNIAYFGKHWKKEFRNQYDLIMLANVPYLPRNFANLLEIISIVVVLSMHKTPAYESENRSKN